jgi:hypothetical protein
MERRRGKDDGDSPTFLRPKNNFHVICMISDLVEADLTVQEIQERAEHQSDDQAKECAEQCQLQILPSTRIFAGWFHSGLIIDLIDGSVNHSRMKVTGVASSS